MINASEIPNRGTTKIDVDSFLKQVEKDALANKLTMDGKPYELTNDCEGIRKIKAILNEHGFSALSDVTGYKNGERNVTMVVKPKAT